MDFYLSKYFDILAILYTSQYTPAELSPNKIILPLYLTIVYKRVWLFLRLLFHIIFSLMTFFNTTIFFQYDFTPRLPQSWFHPCSSLIWTINMGALELAVSLNISPL
jgi:hypothetical protein